MKKKETVVVGMSGGVDSSIVALKLKKQGYKQASLSVQKINYAFHMYSKLGFVIIDENDEEYIMLCKL